MNTSRGRARDFAFWCARKTQPWHVMCLHHQFRATKTLTQTSVDRDPQITLTPVCLEILALN